MIIGILTLSFTATIPTLVVASIFFGVGFGSVQPSLQAWAINRSAPNRKGAANGTFLSGMDLGVAVGTVILGGIAGYTSYAMMYRLSAVFLLILVGVYVGYLVREKKETLDIKEEISV